MNIANLQLEGLYIAVAETQRLLIKKGLITAVELDEALDCAEMAAVSDDRGGALSPAEQDAILFSIRLLRATNEIGNDQQLSFSRLARMVGETKSRPNDKG